MADPAAAARVKKSLRSPHRFHGVAPEVLRTLARRLARPRGRSKDLERGLRAARALWKSPFHEEKTLALLVLAELQRKLEEGHWAELRGWMREVRTADHCDGLAVPVLGSLVKRDRSWCRVLRHWALSKNVWERRAAAGAVLLRARHMGDVEAALEVCEPLMRDRAPAVQGMVREVLREALSLDAELTAGFLGRWRGTAPRAMIDGLVAP
jgi:3-methyladenine DNA glycosylase AlkD